MQGKRVILISIILLIASNSVVAATDDEIKATIRIKPVHADAIIITVRVKQVGIDINESSFDFGFMKFNMEKYTDADRFKVTNVGTGFEDIYVSANMTNWALGTTPNVDQMVFSMKTIGGNFSSWEPIADGDNDIIADDLPAVQSFTFGVKAHSPTSATLFDKQWITVNLSAVTS